MIKFPFYYSLPYGDFFHPIKAFNSKIAIRFGNAIPFGELVVKKVLASNNSPPALKALQFQSLNSLLRLLPPAY